MIKLWDIGKRQIVMELKGHQDYVTQLLYVPSLSTLFSCGADGSVRLWDENGKRQGH